MLGDMESAEFTATGRIFLLKQANLSEHDASWKVMPFILIDVCDMKVCLHRYR
jgi:hypothetical protein